MFWTVLIGLGSVIFGVIVVMLIRDAREPRDLPINVAHSPHPSATGMYRPGWHLLWTHAAPPRPFTATEADEVMRQHVECDPGRCGRKREARRTLVEAGFMKPPTRARLRS